MIHECCLTGQSLLILEALDGRFRTSKKSQRGIIEENQVHNRTRLSHHQCFPAAADQLRRRIPQNQGDHTAYWQRETRFVSCWLQSAWLLYGISHHFDLLRP